MIYSVVLALETVVMGADGYVKLIDFGFVRKLKNANDRRHSQVGTLPDVLTWDASGGCTV